MNSKCGGLPTWRSSLLPQNHEHAHFTRLHSPAIGDGVVSATFPPAAHEGRVANFYVGCLVSFSATFAVALPNGGQNEAKIMEKPMNLRDIQQILERPEAIQLSSGIVSKIGATLEDRAEAIGQG